MQNPFELKQCLFPRGQAGLCCDKDGVALGPVTLVEKCNAVPGKRYRICSPEVFVKAFMIAYGKPPLDVIMHLWQGIGRMTKSLEDGDVPLAMIKAIHLKFPEIEPENMAKLEAGELAKAGYNPDEPRDERGRWTSDEAAGGRSGVAGRQYAQADTGIMNDGSPEDAQDFMEEMVVTAKPLTGPEKPWEKFPDAALRDYLGSQEVSSDAGYGTKHVDIDSKTKSPLTGVGHTALGRYQLRDASLIDAGWKNIDGSWTTKANAAGVTSNNEFLANPDAQEQALTDVLSRNGEQMRNLGVDQFVGTTIKDSKGNDLTITNDGLSAAAHREGATNVVTYIRLQNGDKPEDFENERSRRWAENLYLDNKPLYQQKGIQDKINAIETRLRWKRR